MLTSWKCNTCKHPMASSWIGDGYCDQDIYNEGISCCWDLDDCRFCSPQVAIGKSRGTRPRHLSKAVALCLDLYALSPSMASMKEFACKTCPSFLNEERCGLLGDGTCHEEFMSVNSCFDLGDCWCQLCKGNDRNLRLGKTQKVAYVNNLLDCT